MTSPAETSTQAKETVTVTIDGREIEANPGELLIAAAERSGTYIPRFCYHPRMKPVGMCRMCLVNVEGPRGKSLQVSCMLTVSEGMKVETDAPEVKKAQDGVLEFLLANHPLDCPVCDKGGECPLQDQTLAFGPGETRYVEEKRHFEKPIEISPLVALDRERCILCDRCTRFSKEVAGDPLIHFQNRGNQTEVNTFPDHPFSSYFSGNTVQICPVGALTATPYRFKARPWDLEQVESTCTSCSVGCRVAVQSSADSLTRYLGVDSEPVNHGWLCDKGRFDFEALNSDERFDSPKVRGQQASWGEALAEVARCIHNTSPTRVGFIGGARLSNEDQYAWAKLAKSVVGTDNVDAQLGDGLDPQTLLGVPKATIDEACSADALILMAPDLKEELPVLYLRLREAAVEKGLKVIEVSPAPTSFTEHAAVHIAYRTGDAAGVAAALTSKTSEKSKPDVAGVEPEVISAARSVLADANNVVVVCGRQSLADNGRGNSDAVRVLASKTTAKFLPVLRRSNVMGALDMGLAPGVLPGRVSLDEGRRWFEQGWGHCVDGTGMDTTAMLVAAAAGDIDVLFLLGADPVADFPDRNLALEALSKVETVISVDILPNRSNAMATVVLPASAYAERSGTTTNIEGRITRLGRKVTAPGVAWPDWNIATELAFHLDADLGFDTVESVWNEIELLAPSHRGITTNVLGDKANRDGVVAPFPHVSSSPAGRPTCAVPPAIGYDAAQEVTLPPVEGYSVRLVSARKLYDQGTLVQNSPHLQGLVGECKVFVHSSTLAALGIESGGTVRLRNGRGELEVAAFVDDQVPRGTAVFPFNLTESGGPSALIDATQAVTNVRVETP
jgi:NADH-quinone oxidoreductase subunit G